MRRDVTFVEYELKSSGTMHRFQTHPRTVDIPEQCPICGFATAPIILHSCYIPKACDDAVFVVTLLCTHCYFPFITSYNKRSEQPVQIAPKTLVFKSFDPKIAEISPQFIEIYNQSLAAESMNLNEIAGMGYRKSMEFLIKDFLIRNDPDASDAICNEALSASIRRISNERLKTVASRAVWLGNDFTHYTRKFEDYEISDMKRFIDAVLHWILMELITDEAESMDRR